jgi:ppGpp synthetase/RelA/SpoT-type nucleotidyltranferase
MYTKNQIKKAGKIFKSKDIPEKIDLDDAINSLTYWRSIHGQVLEEIEDKILPFVLEVDEKAIIAKRLKRTPSIVRKLRRLNHIQLNSMQDIAGLRIIVSSMFRVRKLVKILKSNKFAYELKLEDDYITNPKSSGYRSFHLIFKNNNLEIPELDGLLIEVQVRTLVQHAWATAVEIMGTYLNTQLKFNEGQQKWLSYFALTSNAFSFLEKTNSVPQYSKLSEIETYSQSIYEFNYNLISEKLKAFSHISNIICENKELIGKYNLILLNVKSKEVEIKVFESKDLGNANIEFTNLERKHLNNENIQIALVSTKNIQELRNAYPNYFLDTKMFMKKMRIIKRKLSELKNLTPR